MIYKCTVDLDRHIFLVSWEEKDVVTERTFHSLGGSFETFNQYRFELSASKIKAVVSAMRSLGKVTYSPEAKETFQTVIDRAKVLSSLGSRGADADAEVSPLLAEEYPETAGALRNYQRVAVKFMSANPYTLLADDPGSGKTLSTIATMVASGVTGDILVLSPSIATQVVWPAELAQWAPDDEVVRVTGSRKKREEQLAKLRFFSGKSKRRWILCNLEMAKVKYHEPVVVEGKTRKGWYEHVFPELFFIDYWDKQKNPREWSAIVVDESHRALITQKTQSYKQTQIRCGFGKLSVKEGGKKIAISGTPFRGKIQNLWGTLNWLDPKRYRAYWSWVEEWFYTDQKVISSAGETATVVTEMNPAKTKEFYESMAPFTLRRTKAEIAKELPPKTYAGTLPDNLEGDFTEEERRGLIGHWLEMEPKQKRAYQEMTEDAIAYLDSGSVVANGPLAVMTRLKQFAGCYGTLEKKEDSDGFEIDAFKPALPSNKFNWLLEFLTELGIDKDGATGPEANKVVVASQFTSVINIFQAALEKKGIKTLKVSGGVSAKERERAAKLFQTDEGPQVFLLNTNAGGVALTLDRADDIVILDETFIPDDQEQVEDRVHRVSRIHNVTIHYLRSKGTIEESIARTTFGRDRIQKQILDGERGIDYAKKILLTKS